MAMIGHFSIWRVKNAQQARKMISRIQREIARLERKIRDKRRYREFGYEVDITMIELKIDTLQNKVDELELMIDTDEFSSDSIK